MNKVLHWFCFFYTFSVHGLQPWTWSYKTTLERGKLSSVAQRQVLSSLSCQPFTQMLFSWNALRPQRGFFRFYARVRDANKKGWFPWHKLADWGSGVQRSYFESSGGQLTSHCHVRLEVPHHARADALQFAASCHEGAPAFLLKSFAVTVCNLQNFATEVGTSVLDNLPSVLITGIMPQSQMMLEHPKKEVLCSPTSCSMLLSYLLKKEIPAAQFAPGVFDDGLGAFGSWPFNCVHVFDQSQGRVGMHVTRLPSFTALHRYLQLQIPVVVSIRGVLRGAPKEYLHGHLLLVAGYDRNKKQVFCYDPAHAADHDVPTWYDVRSFLRAWERSYRLAYVAEPASDLLRSLANR